MITADEFLLANNEKLLKGLSRLELNELLIEFAKLHVEAALKQASIEAEIYIPDGAYMDCYVNSAQIEIQSYSILNAYPPENIK